MNFLKLSRSDANLIVTNDSLFEIAHTLKQNWNFSTSPMTEVDDVILNCKIADD